MEELNMIEEKNKRLRLSNTQKKAKRIKYQIETGLKEKKKKKVRRKKTQKNMEDKKNIQLLLSFGIIPETLDDEIIK